MLEEQLPDEGDVRQQRDVPRRDLRPRFADVGVAEEQSEFDVILAGAGQQKIQVVKVVKDLLGVGLKDAKDLVDGAPGPIMEKASKEDAEAAKAKLEEVGADVELK